MSIDMCHGQNRTIQSELLNKKMEIKTSKILQKHKINKRVKNEIITHLIPCALQIKP